MTDRQAIARRYKSQAFRRGLRRRRARDGAVKWIGLGAIVVAVAMLGVLLASVAVKGYTAFIQTNIQLEIAYDPNVLDSNGLDPGGERREQQLRDANYQELIRNALFARFGEPEDRTAGRQLINLVSPAADLILRDRVLDNPDLIGTRQTVWLPARDEVNQIAKGNAPRDVPEDQRLLTDRQLTWVDELRESGALELRFNKDFFLNTASRDPEVAGIVGAVVGSLLTLFVTAVLCVPIAVAAAVYLEEFAPKNWFTDLLEVNINNLAAVPSIIFGLLGLAVFINFFGIPRSTPLVGGMALALLSLPTIIIASRAALKAVPPSFREGAMMVGASRLQAVLFHVLPYAFPGILTGVILGMAEALGETAPLLLVGMVAYVSAVPDGLTAPASVLPVQIYLWATGAQRGFEEKAAACILVLLVFLVLMNAAAIVLRKRLERRW